MAPGAAAAADFQNLKGVVGAAVRWRQGAAAGVQNHHQCLGLTFSSKVCFGSRMSARHTH
eukprot:1148275-Pelagomonas_calceolata.AAC.4